MKNHLKRISMPKSWIAEEKKGLVWITRPKPGAHSFNMGVPLVVVLRDMIKYAKNTREVRNILFYKDVLVDGKKRRDHKFIVGFMDVISIPELKENYRMILDKKGKINIIKIDDSKIKLCKIVGKSHVKKKVQLNLFDGKNILVDKDVYKVNETVVLELPEQKIKEQLKFEKGASIYLIGGKRIGQVGSVADIKDNVVSIKTKESSFNVSKEHCFVIGKEKPVIKL